MTIDPTLTEVAFNFKTPRGRTRAYKLGRRNLITGDNGEGKSAIEQAVALAVSGAVDDLAGQTTTRDPDLLMGMAYRRGLGGDPLFARVDFDTDERCQWEALRDGSSIKRPNHIRPSWVTPEDSKARSPHFPMREVNDVLTGSAKKARERFLEWVCHDLTEDEVLGHLTPYQEAYQQVVANVRTTSQGERLAHAASEADKLMRAASRDSKANEKLIEDLGADLGRRVTETEVLSQRDKVRELQVAYEDAVRRDAAASSADRREALNESLTLLREKERGLEAQRKSLVQQIEDLQDDSWDTEKAGVDGAVQAFRWASTENYFPIEGTADVSCPFCSSAVQRDHMLQCHDFYETRAHDMARDGSELAGLRLHLSQVDEELRRARSRIGAINEDITSLPTPSDDGAPDLESARADVEAARLKLDALNTAYDSWKQLDKAKERIKTLRDDTEKWRGLKIKCQKAAKRILEQRTDTFCERVNDYLPDGWEFGVMVDDDGRDVFLYGLYEDSDYGPYLKVGLSEGQRAAVLAALCSVLADINDQPLVIIRLEDRGWDSDTLSDVLFALTHTPHHVFITSTTVPSAVPPAWNHIHVGDVREEEPAQTRPSKLGSSIDEAPETSEPAETVAPEPEDAPDGSVALSDLDPVLLAKPTPMPSGRARGGKFRAARMRVAAAIEEHGLSAVALGLAEAHPEATFLSDLAAPEFAETVAHYLFPIDPAAD